MTKEQCLQILSQGGFNSEIASQLGHYISVWYREEVPFEKITEYVQNIIDAIEEYCKDMNIDDFVKDSFLEEVSKL